MYVIFVEGASHPLPAHYGRLQTPKALLFLKLGMDDPMKRVGGCLSAPHASTSQLRDSFSGLTLETRQEIPLTSVLTVG